MSKCAATLGILALLTPAPLRAETAVPLNEDEHITESLVAAQTGDIIRKSCASITARFFVFYEKAAALEQYARDQGYTEDEVKAFLRDPEEKARIRGLAEAYLAAAGVVAGDEESYCVAGRAEIAAGTLAGSLLRSWK